MRRIPTSLRAIIRLMRPAALFLIALFGVTWTLSFVWRPPAEPESLWAFLAPLLPSFWAPTIIAVILTALIEGTAGLRNEIRARLSYTRGSGRWFLLAAIMPILATLIGVFSGRAAADGAPFISSAAILPMIGVQVVTGAVGEELGWRGFLLPRLSKRFGETIAGWIMAMLWSLWHAPAWLHPSLPHRTMPLISTLLFVVFFGVFLSFVFHRAGGSVLVTILAHLSLNIMTGIGGVQLSSVIFWRTLAGIFGAFALLITIASRTRPPNH